MELDDELGVAIAVTVVVEATVEDLKSTAWMIVPFWVVVLVPVGHREI